MSRLQFSPIHRICNVVRVCLQAALALAAIGMAANCAALPVEPDLEYPTRRIRIIVASSTGTASDIFARSLASELAAF